MKRAGAGDSGNKVRGWRDVGAVTSYRELYNDGNEPTMERLIRGKAACAIRFACLATRRCAVAAPIT